MKNIVVFVYKNTQKRAIIENNDVKDCKKRKNFYNQKRIFLER